MALHDVRSDSFDAHPDAPVLLLLHGYGAGEHDLVPLADQVWPGRWAALRAPLAIDWGGSAWFPIPAEGQDHHAISVPTAAIWEWVDANVGPGAPVIPMGFSQGGCMSLEVLRERPDRVPTAVLLSGLRLNTPHPRDPDVANLKPPVFHGRGDTDPVIPQPLITTLVDYLASHTTVTERIYPGLGHSVSQAEIADVRDFLDRWRATLGA